VADDVERMVDLAVSIAQHPATHQRLAELRRHMRVDLRVSPACDTPALTRSMEQFYASVLSI